MPLFKGYSLLRVSLTLGVALLAPTFMIKLHAGESLAVVSDINKITFLPAPSLQNLLFVHSAHVTTV